MNFSDLRASLVQKLSEAELSVIEAEEAAADAAIAQITASAVLEKRLQSTRRLRATLAALDGEPPPAEPLQQVAVEPVREAPRKRPPKPSGPECSSCGIGTLYQQLVTLENGRSFNALVCNECGNQKML